MYKRQITWWSQWARGKIICSREVDCKCKITEAEQSMNKQPCFKSNCNLCWNSLYTKKGIVQKNTENKVTESYFDCSHTYSYQGPNTEVTSTYYWFHLFLLSSICLRATAESVTWQPELLCRTVWSKYWLAYHRAPENFWMTSVIDMYWRCQK